MATFTTFNNRLPDPTFAVTDAGSVAVTGSVGSGFMNAKIDSSEDNQVSRTISGRGIHRSNNSQYWMISIRYNPMRRDAFDVVSSFIHSRRGRKFPFFVVLPQYSKPKNPNFYNFVLSNPITVASSHASGSSKMMLASAVNMSSYPKPGDYFNVVDPMDANHLKAYKVTMVETPALYQAGTLAPASNQVRIHFNPPLRKFVSNSAIIRFVNPQFRVITKGDIIEEELDKDNLYRFSLDLEEIQP